MGGVGRGRVHRGHFCFWKGMVMIQIMSNAKKNNIIVSENGIDYKIIKIIPHSDGGFGVYLPYLNLKESIFLGIIELPAEVQDRLQSGEELLIPTTAILEKHKTDKRIKLSIHQDGFVQFSGDGVRSGREKMTGKAKGLGVVSKPLMTPISTGSTFSVTFWGLDCFERMNNIKSRKDVKDIKFSPKEQYVFANLSKKLVERTNGYIISGYVFPLQMSHYIYFDELGAKITVPIPDEGNAVMTLRVITFPHSDVFLGLLLRETWVGDESLPPSGFMVGGPKEIVELNGVIVERSLFASVPKWFNGGSSEVIPTLNYE